MGLIKAADVPADALGFSFPDLEQQADDLLHHARRLADELMASAAAEADILRTAAVEHGRAEGHAAGYDEGFSEGREDGKRESMQEQSEVLDRLSSTLISAASALEGDRLKLAAEARTGVLRLSAAIARRITGRLGRIDSSVLKHSVEQAMQRVLHATDVHICIHPEQLEQLQAMVPQINRNWPQLKHVEIVADESIAAGGCRLVTAGGSVDADLNAQLDRVIDQLIPRPRHAP